MQLHKKVNLIFYRFKERGLEVFLLNKSDEWGLPEGEVSQEGQPDCIELDPSDERDEALAMEGDWHEIPSLKGMLYEDAQLLKEKLKDIEGGAYVTIKDALKKRLSPAQYKFLKELKDVLMDRNSVRDI
ncbi:MAG: hypothetical protein AAFY36_03020 [Bacteroidota bacterium]